MSTRGASQARKPSKPPRTYVSDWPEGQVRQVPDDEGGEAVEWATEQAMRLAGQIIRRREARGLRRSQLAVKTGLRPNTILDLEEGRTWPDLRTLGLIAWVLEADLEFEPRIAMRAAEKVSRYRTD